jgi:hypothetical protein
VRLDLRVSGDLSDDVRRIADLERALPSTGGKISYATNVTLIVPATAGAGNGTLLIDVPNRGRTLAAGLFNSPRSPMLPIGPFERGNGFLQDNGFAVAVVAWELGHGVELPTIKAEDGSPRFIEGAALAIVRDVTAFLQSNELVENPLRGTVRRTIGVGYSLPLPRPWRRHNAACTRKPILPRDRLKTGTLTESANPTLCSRVVSQCHVARPRARMLEISSIPAAASHP